MTKRRKLKLLFYTMHWLLHVILSNLVQSCKRTDGDQRRSDSLTPFELRSVRIQLNLKRIQRLLHA